ncbi:beta-ketoacyl synthase N-terminal-like domain-containing protein [Streptomyces sp. NPDC051976]|uniref:beta-ketoacyl synthase N-terminal-like domain-containing protein n=1 Tax=Streptomyces sp. NPDC051976 TaxID=3154947 RepID=UPI00342F147D
MNGVVVVTGLGIVSPAGLGLRDYWAQACGAGTEHRPGGTAAATRDPLWPAGALSGPAVHEHLWGRPAPQADRMARLALAAADWALADAGIRPQDLPDFGPDAVTAVAAAAAAAAPVGGRGAGSWSGGGFGPRTTYRPGGLGRPGGPAGRQSGAYRSFAWFYAVSSGQISVRDAMIGLDAVAYARRQIRQGGRLMVSGGVDAPVCPSAGTQQTAAVRPGGGALLVLETAGTALARGAKMYGEVAGYGATFDPDRTAGREPGLRRALELALADASAVPGEVDAVFVPGVDAAEAAAVTAVFGVHGVPVTAPRTVPGRRHPGAAAPLDLAAALLAMEEGLIPPTAEPPPSPGYDLNLVLTPRTAELRTTVVLARGHGGFNSAVVLRTVE